MQVTFTPRCLYAIAVSNSDRVERMGLGGLEPPTSSLSGMRSNQLSYKPLGKRTTCPTQTDVW